MRIVVLFFLFLLTAGWTAGASPAPPGDGRDFLVPGFERIRVDGPFIVTVAPGMTARAHAEARRPTLDRIAIRVLGDTLVISAGEQGWNNASAPMTEMPRVTVAVPRLRAVQVNGGGHVTIRGMAAPRVDFGLNGAGTLAVSGIAAEDVNLLLMGGGSVTLAGESERARLRANGTGSVDAASLLVKDVTILAETSGEVAAQARYGAQVFALGAGNVRVTGRAQCSVTGPGPVSCAAGFSPTR